jgi:hypothetical protein
LINLLLPENARYFVPDINFEVFQSRWDCLFTPYPFLKLSIFTFHLAVPKWREIHSIPRGGFQKPVPGGSQNFTASTGHGGKFELSP